MFYSKTKIICRAKLYKVELSNNQQPRLIAATVTITEKPGSDPSRLT